MLPRRFALPLAALLAASPTAARPDDDESVKARAGKFEVQVGGYFTRLVYDGTMIGTQFNDAWRLHRADVPVLSGVFTPWEALAAGGALYGWDAKAEPLAYYHRCGPVGALFHHLRTRKGGADAVAPVGVVGLFAGTPAAYARPGQSFTFYTAHPESRELVAETDRWFTYLPDARKRGAKVEVRYGHPRTALPADPAKRFALLLVETIEDSFDPADRLTLEAVKLYFDRTTPDGLVALHVSNKYYRLEPVVERIARELKLVSRVWVDDSEGRPGKATSIWVVLARTEADLGVLARPLPYQIAAYGTANGALARLVAKYPWLRPAPAVLEAEYGLSPAAAAQLGDGLKGRVGAEEQAAYAALAKHPAGRQPTLGDIAERVFGPMFHPLPFDRRVELRTDAARPPLPRTDRPLPKE